jgi:hypothetical protein
MHRIAVSKHKENVAGVLVTKKLTNYVINYESYSMCVDES